jgi:prepilin-type N-terminal cleavage/methylation domain-containing protein
MKPLSPIRKGGFTLIELLIVVAIIAILAAIAVPNFLEAQTRSKVSRVMADARSLATAVETYIVDNNKLFRTYRQVGETRTWICSKLTTPIAYMTSIPKDPFNNVDGDSDNRVIVLWGPDYIEGGVTIDGITIPDVSARGAIFFSPYPEYSDGSQLLKQNFWVLFSLGPNQLYDILVPSYPSPMVPYDPTNGTVSAGDIVRFKS